MKSPGKIGLVIVVLLAGLVLIIHFLSRGIAISSASGPGASINVGKTETHTSTSSSSTSCSSDNSTFSARHVLLFSDNPHPLNQRVVALLAQQLSNCRYIERVDTRNQPFTLTNGTDAPDLFVAVNLAALDESGILSSSMKATFTASLGNAPWQSTSYTSDDTTPPLVSFNWNATLETDMTFTGVRTDHYGTVAETVATNFTQAICKQIEELSGKYPALPELPRDFYGPYQPVADFDCLKELNASRMVSYCGLLTHNQTFWQFKAGTNPVPQLQRIIGQLEAAGWKVSDAQLTNTMDYRIRARQEDAEMEIFRLRDEHMGFSPIEEKPAFLKFVAHYRKPFSRAEREAALDRVLDEQHPVEMLLPFEHSFTSAQRQKFYALLEKSPATSPRASIQLANVYLNRKETNSAVHQLTCAKALAATMDNSTAVISDIDDIAKKIFPKQSPKLTVTPEVCRELGFLELTNREQTIEQKRELGKPLVIFGPTSNGVRIVSLTINPPVKNSYPWSLIQSEEGMRSWSSSSFDLSSGGDWHESFKFNDQTVKITAVPLPGTNQVKLSIQTGS